MGFPQRLLADDELDALLARSLDDAFDDEYRGFADGGEVNDRGPRERRP